MRAMTKFSSEKKFADAAEFFKEMRLRRGLTQDEVARFLGYKTQQIVSNWERGRCTPPLNKLHELMNLLDLDKKETIAVFLNETEKNLMRKLSPKEVRKQG
jgi:transcriptional regulator with XRE-family HTH domain